MKSVPFTTNSKQVSRAYNLVLSDFIDDSHQNNQPRKQSTFKNEMQRDKLVAAAHPRARYGLTLGFLDRVGSMFWTFTNGGRLILPGVTNGAG
jgi:hypothetical protein